MQVGRWEYIRCTRTGRRRRRRRIEREDQREKGKVKAPLWRKSKNEFILIRLVSFLPLLLRSWCLPYLHVHSSYISPSAVRPSRASRLHYKTENSSGKTADDEHRIKRWGLSLSLCNIGLQHWNYYMAGGGSCELFISLCCCCPELNLYVLGHKSISKVVRLLTVAFVLLYLPRENLYLCRSYSHRSVKHNRIKSKL